MTPRLTLSLPDRDRPRPTSSPAPPAPGSPATSSTGRPSHPARRDAAWLIDGQPHGFATADAARLVPPHPLGRPPEDGPALRRRRARVRAHGDRGADRRGARPPSLEIRYAPQLSATGPHVPRRRRALPGPASTLRSTSMTAHARSGSTRRSATASTTSAPTPTPTQRKSAIAQRHGRRIDEVLPTAGAAEAFGLIARARPWRRPVVVHPQFTEPDVALAAAGHRARARPPDPRTASSSTPRSSPTTPTWS